MFCYKNRKNSVEQARMRDIVREISEPGFWFGGILIVDKLKKI